VVVSTSDKTLRVVGDGLRAVGFQVEEVRNGLDTLRLLADRSAAKVEVLVLDLTRQPWVGVRLLDTIRRESWTLPVVLVTGKPGRSAVLTAARRLNIHGVLVQPLNQDAVRQAMGQMSIPHRATSPT
jgi:DNA-binding NtrC family response regulator